MLWGTRHTRGERHNKTQRGDRFPGRGQDDAPPPLSGGDSLSPGAQHEARLSRRRGVPKTPRTLVPVPAASGEPIRTTAPHKPTKHPTARPQSHPTHPQPNRVAEARGSWRALCAGSVASARTRALPRDARLDSTHNVRPSLRQLSRAEKSPLPPPSALRHNPCSKWWLRRH